MYPIILLSDNPDKLDEFIQMLVTEGGYLPFFTYKIEPIKTEISIDQIRAIKKEIITDIPHKRLIIIYNFDTASLEAQNAFLKTLEEKNKQNQFILIVVDQGRVLPTIQSRSKLVNIKEKSPKEVGNVAVELLQEMNNTGYGFLSRVSAINRDDALRLFDQIIFTLEDKLKKGEKNMPAILKKALQQKSLLQNNNLNPQLAVDSFLLFYKKYI